MGADVSEVIGLATTVKGKGTVKLVSRLDVF